jgi:hypothetical protein
MIKDIKVFVTSLPFFWTLKLNKVLLSPTFGIAGKGKNATLYPSFSLNIELGVPEKICAYTTLSSIVEIEIKNSVPVRKTKLIRAE